MKITITSPAFGPNGGLRIIADVAHELSKNHEVTIFCPDKTSPYYPINVRTVSHENELKDQDVLIIGSPHHIHLNDLNIKAKRFAYIQMMEHLFHPNNPRFRRLAHRFYSELPYITMAHWGLDEIQKINNKRFLYTANSVNYDLFPLIKKRKDGKVVLLESPMPTNPTKDKNMIALKVSKRLKEMGYIIKGYGAIKADLDEFHVLPSIEKMNELYSEATILIKATVLDFQSTAPIEAGTKNCLTIRAINHGDDNLIDNFNCLRVKYNEDELLKAAIRGLEDEELRKRLVKNMMEQLKNNPWEKHVKQIEEFICT